ncbi:MAG: hypothetical protein NTV70_01510, partial [Acidobacteria bacterium]|nr:hypothetical protein [Acidobacteriota bacterium]
HSFTTLSAVPPSGRSLATFRCYQRTFGLRHSLENLHGASSRERYNGPNKLTKKHERHNQVNNRSVLSNTKDKVLAEYERRRGQPQRQV